jgi:hypothetical protein
MKTSEKFALNEWLIDYPEDMLYDDLIELMLDGDELCVTPWETVEHYSYRQIVEFIEGTRSHFEAVTADAFKALEASK